jgi:hypothetical protein
MKDQVKRNIIEVKNPVVRSHHVNGQKCKGQELTTSKKVKHEMKDQIITYTEWRVKRKNRLRVSIKLTLVTGLRE